MTAKELLASLGFTNIKQGTRPNKVVGNNVHITGSYQDKIFADFRYSDSIRYYRLQDENGTPIIYRGGKHKFPLNLSEFVKYFEQAKQDLNLMEGKEKKIKEIKKLVEAIQKASGKKVMFKEDNRKMFLLKTLNELNAICAGLHARLEDPTTVNVAGQQAIARQRNILTKGQDAIVAVIKFLG